jgi:osmotically-inducible protein OsmY
MKTDEQLQADVLAELRSDPRIHSNEIGVIVKDGGVTLTGLVADYAEKLAAESAAKRVKGVRAIAEDVEVKMPAEIRTSDEGLAERISQILSWSSPFRNTNIQAEVRQGHVTLTGDVERLYQKQTAAQRIAELEGVRGIFNRIRVLESNAGASPREIERQIMTALHRHANVEASHVRVSVAKGTVTLEGTVGAYHERELIEDAARSAAGVREVVDNLTVSS